MSSSQGLEELTAFARDPDAEWMAWGLCIEIDPELWFPPEDWRGHSSAANTRRPKAVCAQCPVRGECLEWALAHGEEGIWGGTTREERDQLLEVAA
jgi:WhiB family redox-sensing transcriptional regulator